MGLHPLDVVFRHIIEYRNAIFEKKKSIQLQTVLVSRAKADSFTIMSRSGQVDSNNLSTVRSEKK